VHIFVMPPSGLPDCGSETTTNRRGKKIGGEGGGNSLCVEVDMESIFLTAFCWTQRATFVKVLNPLVFN